MKVYRDSTTPSSPPPSISSKSNWRRVFSFSDMLLLVFGASPLYCNSAKSRTNPTFSCFPRSSTWKLSAEYPPRSVRHVTATSNAWSWSHKAQAKAQAKIYTRAIIVCHISYHPDRIRKCHPVETDLQCFMHFFRASRYYFFKRVFMYDANLPTF
jgi:hypothetical protein